MRSQLLSLCHRQLQCLNVQYCRILLLLGQSSMLLTLAGSLRIVCESATDYEVNTCFWANQFCQL